MSMRLSLQLISEPSLEPADDDGQLTLDFASTYKRLPAGRTGADVTSITTAPDRIDAALQEMRDFLNRLHPATDAEALQSLRLAFPATPLGERIAAIRSGFFA